jgi:hypothetical protein
LQIARGDYNTEQKAGKSNAEMCQLRECFEIQTLTVSLASKKAFQAGLRRNW